MGEGMDFAAGARDDGGANEDSGDGFLEPGERESVFETVDLGSEGVSPDGDVEKV